MHDYSGRHPHGPEKSPPLSDPVALLFEAGLDGGSLDALGDQLRPQPVAHFVHVGVHRKPGGQVGNSGVLASLQATTPMLEAKTRHLFHCLLRYRKAQTVPCPGEFGS